MICLAPHRWQVRQMPAGYDKINGRFEKAVTMLQENLQYLADEAKVSDKFISMHNAIIKALIDYQHLTMEIIEDFQYDNHMLASEKDRELKDIKLCFEAICIIHGIMDFVAWMEKGKQYLVAMAVDFYRDGEMQIPSKLMEIIDSLPSDKRELVMNILNEKGREKWRIEFETLQRNLEKSKHAGTQRDQETKW